MRNLFKHAAISLVSHKPLKVFQTLKAQTKKKIVKFCCKAALKKNNPKNNSKKSLFS